MTYFAATKLLIYLETVVQSPMRAKILKKDIFNIPKELIKTSIYSFIWRDSISGLLFWMWISDLKSSNEEELKKIYDAHMAKR